MSIEEQDLEQLTDKLAEKLRSKRAIPNDKHDAHHEWVENQIKEEADNREFKKKIIQSSTIWALPALLGFLALMLWKGFLLAIKSGGLQ